VLFRSMALGLTGVFVPIYMLRLGYTLADICWVVTCFFATCVAADIAAAHMVAKVGPKHTLMVGAGVQVLSTASFVMLSSFHLPLVMLGFLWGLAASFFFIPFHVDFSKVKHRKHGGKELGYLTIVDKVGHLLGPLAGGVIASTLGPEYAFTMAAVVLVVGYVPLFKTAEPVRVHQKLDFNGLRLSTMKRDLISYSAVGIENTLSMIFWPMMLGYIILTGQAGYLQLGVLTSASVVAAMYAARWYGRRIDNHTGRKLLRTTAILNAALHMVRPWTANYAGAIAVNVANDVLTAGYRMPYFKGYYDAADDRPGQRIVYLSVMQSFSSLSKATVWAMLTILALSSTSGVLFRVGFTIAAIASLVIILERYSALKPRSRS
jgi:MFS family permease